jgi:VanZ family protein
VTGFLLLVIALIVYGSLYPFAFDFHRAVNPLTVLLHSWPAGFDRFVLRDAVINLLLYTPLGVAAFLAVVRRHSRAAALGAALLLGMALSSCLEMLQVYDARRMCSLFDVSTNTVGACCGAMAALVFRPKLERLTAGRKGAQPHAALVLVLFWFAYQLFPLFPVLSRTRLRAGPAGLIGAAGFSWAEVWVAAAGWFVVALVLEALLHRLRAWHLAAAMLCLPARFFIVSRAPRLDEFLGAALALIIWSAVGAGARLRAGFWMLLSAVAMRELEPLHFLASAQPFSWIPFAASLEAGRQPAVVVLFEKAFYYGAGVWLGHARGWTYARAATAMAAILAVLEWTQRYLPGRSPEITDAFLALLMGLILWFVGSGRAKNKKSGRPR